ncbi:hypothetical protein ACIBG5_22385 [Kribbella sp. NPDC050241]|uniref:hypothetical protein n=1 Tax=Kribbella sp. NPDC050241 TaxID=3364115 RepID=UPI0037B2B5DA
MSQPPEGGYPPPSQGQPGYAGPPQGYQPQPGYQQPQGFQQQPCGTPGSYLYTVTAYGPLAELDEAFLGVKAPIEEVAGGSCYSSDERARDCAVTNGKIVVMVGTAWTSATKRPRTDAQMIQDGKKFADALTQGQ